MVTSPTLGMTTPVIVLVPMLVPTVVQIVSPESGVVTVWVSVAILVWVAVAVETGMLPWVPLAVILE
jgi:hypothetical protein